ncbi:MAG: CrcB family protein [Actinomycetota bacterium]|nr:CrcB family protein [Actinomycetota bacterium]
MITTAAIIAGGLGALARYGLTGIVQRRTGSSQPWGTAVVNITGAALLGMLITLHAAHRLPEAVLTVAGTGFAGGFTTFSTWMVESVRLTEPPTPRQLRAAAVNLAGMFAAGIAAVATTSWLLNPT